MNFVHKYLAYFTTGTDRVGYSRSNWSLVLLLPDSLDIQYYFKQLRNRPSKWNLCFFVNGSYLQYAVYFRRKPRHCRSIV